MSQENVEKVRAWLATWDREILRSETRPFERINSMAFGSGLYAPDAVYEDGVLPDHAGEPPCVTTLPVARKGGRSLFSARRR
jgi:hypothetical protein